MKNKILDVQVVNKMKILYKIHPHLIKDELEYYKNIIYTYKELKSIGWDKTIDDIKNLSYDKINEESDIDDRLIIERLNSGFNCLHDWYKEKRKHEYIEKTYYPKEEKELKDCVALNIDGNIIYVSTSKDINHNMSINLNMKYEDLKDAKKYYDAQDYLQDKLKEIVDNNSFNIAKSNIDISLLKDNEGWIYPDCYLKEYNYKDKDWLLEDLTYHLFDLITNNCNMYYKSYEVNRNNLLPIEDRKKAEDLILYINGNKIIYNLYDNNFLENIVIQEIRRQNKLELNTELKPFILKATPSICKEVRTIQFINKEGVKDHKTEGFHIINIYERSNKEIIKEINSLGDYKYRLFKYK